MHRLIISNSRENFLLADHTKLGRAAFSGICSLDKINHFITDKHLPSQWNTILSKNGNIIDVWGVIGSTEDYGKDVTMRRNPDVKFPSATFNESEWSTFEKDDISDLGKHTMN